jgi:hypothetical protein
LLAWPFAEPYLAEMSRDDPHALTKPLGRPPSKPYDAEIAEEICIELMSSSVPLKDILASDARFPGLNTFYKWLYSNADFEKLYAQAKELRADFLADEVLAISDADEGDARLEYNAQGVPYAVIDGKNVQRSRLMADSRKWLASKLNARRYGDQLDLTSKGEALAAPINAVAIDARVQSIMLLADERRRGAKLLED